MATDPAKWIASRPILYAMIDNIRFDGVLSFSSSTELNNIPTASIALPTGRDMSNVAKIAQVHSSYQQLSQDVPAQVYLQILPRGNSPDAPVTAWPAEPFVLFDGFVAGVSWDRSDKASQVVVTLIHWLSSLNEASALSATSQPGNPANFTFSASSDPSGGDSGGNATTWLPAKTAVDITGDAITVDMWAKVLLPVLQGIANGDTLDISTIDEHNITPNTASRDRIVQALGKFTLKAPDYVPLALDVSDANTSVIADSIAAAISNEAATSWTNTTIWGKLIGDWASYFGFAVCPRVQDAIVIPQAGAIHTANTPYITITTDDYTAAKTVSATPQQIQAVGILGSYTADAGGHMAENSNPTGLPPILGIFPGSPAVRDTGMLILKGTPPWLSDAVQKESYARETIGGDPEGGITGIPNGMDPGGQKLAATDPNEVVSTLVGSGIISRWAQHLYINEKLRGCVLELVGRFRVDIAPGSMVSVELPGSRF